MAQTTATGGGLKTFQTKAQNLGARLSNMVLPNLSAFMGWGVLTVLAVWLENDMLLAFNGPILKYLLPVLVGYAGGNAIFGYKGGVLGAFVTMGTIISTDITMFIGAMIMAPIAAALLKKSLELIEPHTPAGFEILFESLTGAVIGCVLAVLGYLFIAPFIAEFSALLATGVNFLEKNALLPLTALIIEPAKVIFLNSAINTGVLMPIGTVQVDQIGKSILFLLESNPGPGLGILLAYCIFGLGASKANAYGATAIHFLGGIHEMYFPFVMMHPSLVIAVILGGITGDAIFTAFGVGLIAPAAPGSIITILAMTHPGDHIGVLAGIVFSAAVSFVVASVILKRIAAKQGEDSAEDLAAATAKMEELKGKKSRATAILNSSENELADAAQAEAALKATGDDDAIDYASIKKIVYVCGNGVGTSAMGASVIAKKLKKAGIEDIPVPHSRLGDLPVEADLIVTHDSLADAVRTNCGDVPVIQINDYLNAPQYDEIVGNIVKARS